MYLKHISESHFFFCFFVFVLFCFWLVGFVLVWFGLVWFFFFFFLSLETVGWFWFNWSQMWLPFFHLWNCLVRIQFELFYVTGSKGMSRIWLILILELQTKKGDKFLNTCVLRWTLSKNCPFLGNQISDCNGEELFCGLRATFLRANICGPHFCGPKFAQIGCVEKSNINFADMRRFSLNHVTYRKIL